MTIREEHTAGGKRAIRLNRPGVRQHWWPRGVDVLAVAVLVALAASGGITADPAPAGRAAPVRPVLAAPTAAPVGTPISTGVQPGGVLRTDAGLCTLNFLFTGSDGRRYIGTAGHCVLGQGSLPLGPGGGQNTERSWPPGSAPEARDADGRRIGEFAYAVLEDPSRDFALIRLDPTVAPSAGVAFFGGPTGINGDTASDPVVLEYYGNGIGIGSVLPARSAVAPSLSSPDRVDAVGLAVPGDSGSAVISADGRAVGVLVTTGINIGGLSGNAVEAGTIGITRLGPQLTRAQDVLNLRLHLEVAPLG